MTEMTIKLEAISRDIEPKKRIEVEKYFDQRLKSKATSWRNIQVDAVNCVIVQHMLELKNEKYLSAIYGQIEADNLGELPIKLSISKGTDNAVVVNLVGNEIISRITLGEQEWQRFAKTN